MNPLHFSLISRTVAAAMLLAGLTSHASTDGALSVLRGYCIATQGDVSAILREVGSSNGVEFSADDVKASRVFAVPGGRIFVVVYGGERYGVLAGPDGSCAVDADDDDLQALLSRLADDYSLSRPVVDTTQAMTMHTLARTERSPLAGAGIVVSVPLRGARHERFIRITVMPRAAQ